MSHLLPQERTDRMRLLNHTLLLTAALAVIFSSGPARAQDSQRTLLFEDDFERVEVDEDREEVGNGWSTNSGSRAGGNKQVDLNNGTMVIFIHPTADHAVSVRHDAEFRDGQVVIRFMLENEKDTLTLNFADPQLKSVHAGHLFKISTNVGRSEIEDLKTGKMDLKLRTDRVAGKPVPESTQKMLLTKRKRFKNKVQAGTWYDMVVTIQGDTLSAKIDDENVGSFSSPGIAHETKRLLRLSVPKRAVVDSIQVYRLTSQSDATIRPEVTESDQ